MKLNTTKNKLSAAIIISTAMLSGTASAGTIIDQWGFSTESSFSNVSFTTGGSGTQASSSAEISWGGGGNFQTAGSNRSAMTIGTSTSKTGGVAATGTVNTTFGGAPTVPAGEIGLGTSFTHWNNPLAGTSATLLSGTVNDSLRLTPLIPGPIAGSPFVDAPDLAFNFEFRETPNNGPCAGSTATPCGDLFGFAGTPNLNLQFTYDDIDYFASIFVLNEALDGSPIAFLNDGQCDALGFTTGTSGQRCQGFLTAESAFTTVQFGFAVTTAPINVNVPEPGSLALFGLALAGVGFSKRKTAKV